MTNEYLAPFVDELFNLGVREAVFSPGSRSTALAMLFEEYQQYDTYVDIDERSAAFFALGIAKAKHRPVVLVCTSGSAGAHHFPAITEAKASRIPLIVLTADRPSELQFVGAPQTADQTRFFGHFVNHYENLETPQETNFWTYPRKVAQRAFLAAMGNAAGPVQINVPLRDPLVPELNPKYYEKGRSAHAFRVSAGKMTTSFDEKIFTDKTLILAGPDANADADSHHAILKLAEQLNAPALADPLSNLRQSNHPNIIDSYDAFLTNAELKMTLKPELILLFGQIPVSKRVQQFIQLHADSEFVQVDPSLSYRNPSQTTTYMVQSDAKTFAESVQFANTDTAYLSKWQTAQQQMREKLDTVINESESFEGRFVVQLQENFPENGQMLVSNSMEIRDVDYWWQKGKSTAKLFGNRGVNGIDGTESTALGLSTTGLPTVLLTGDLSMLHDLNGLIIGKTHALNLTIVLFNNDGGGIFHHLAQKGVPNFDYLFSTPHGLDFSALSVLTGLDYHLVDSYDDFDQIFRRSVSTDGIHLLEIKTDKDRSLALHKKYTEK
ncbi:2-succinyl-5-enolpyruvyl-6-hydroxy-3-cyclohexene-1-carboxylic-acid synthase [Lactococcus allomyrinae]|uniref:2-succinyl-5-enolpyruvyl-6-hydroxy-3-cyclohexene-1-carboxylate synthase n=1 Tax=Lactococcus allomyrinae TaxID=2419773 RepID=A0A387BCY8_9LACT|nr:2-succinyl-5-enolpyruvyl-6-hydroxy-3-cyclohexene-1-carboxylic-acid synthase [Lactococcus allomyrinae]AYF99901.1 2-succinyl-5-enolpyruvyl-6-hydroxy-3-cyclohexene-1-carboxylic-acid synthase [Lactococcus allomyrinae]